jgi:hypothetical protein
MDVLIIILIVLGAYILIGLGVFFWFDFLGWPDSGQAMPGCALACALLFFPSYLLYSLICGLWHGLWEQMDDK